MRDATLHLSREALLHNVARVKALAPQSRVLAMVKAEAYGHGATVAAAFLAPHVDALGVAFLEEALALRDAGIVTPIVLMEGVFDDYELTTARAKNMHLMVHRKEQIDLLARHSQGQPVTAWLKVNSGMNRLGFSPEDAPQAYQRLETLPAVNRIILCSHFAAADDPDSAQTGRQLSVMNALAERLPALPVSLANSAAILRLPETHRQWVRPGIMLYGSSPFSGQSAESLELKPVMTLRSRVIAVQPLAAGQPVGYSATWTTPQDTRIAVVAIGYGDGYPRHAPSGTPVLVNGRRYPLVGRVSMDMITVDIGDDAVSPGDAAVLWGEGLSADEVAAHAGTISYELFCRLTARVRRLWS
ncbi:MAG TPA: alanine racemase [Fluviicoccus sp.]|nr:alanine racemase [Fluviicoccus sp.]